MDIELTKNKVVPEKNKTIKKALYIFSAVLMFLAICFVFALAIEYAEQIDSFHISLFATVSDWFNQLPSLMQNFIFVVLSAIFVVFMFFIMIVALARG